MAMPDLAYRVIGWFSTTRLDRFLHPLLFRATGGRGITRRVLGSDQLLLTTTGRRRGRPRTVALFAFAAAEGGWIVVGSRGGSGRVPDWAYNLLAEPAAIVRTPSGPVDVIAHELAGEEYEAAFERAASAYPGYRLYRRNARHHIPIFRLAPR